MGTTYTKSGYRANFKAVKGFLSFCIWKSAYFFCKYSLNSLMKKKTYITALFVFVYTAIWFKFYYFQNKSFNEIFQSNKS